MYFVVGLGNPGREHVGTRHNVGFEVVGCLADRHRYRRSKRLKGAEVSKGRVAGQDVLLVQPMTYMNLSGDAVSGVLRYYKGEPEQLVVIHDELDFEAGVVRLKLGGGPGGHNGLRSIIGHVGRDFARIRIGIGKPPRRGTEHVLGRIDVASRPLIAEAIELSSDAVEMILSHGIAAAMNHFNRKEDDS